MAQPDPKIATVHEQIAWAYANLARAHVALDEGSVRYRRHHHIIRSRLYSGLIKRTMNMRSVFDDERLKMVLPQVCVYCGSAERLSLDHLIPRRLCGTDDPANLVWACRQCNSTKGSRDMLRWLLGAGRFPSIYVLRRYLKSMYGWCEGHDILDRSASSIDPGEIPFALNAFPLTFPPLESLRIWVEPSCAQITASVPPST